MLAKLFWNNAENRLRAGWRTLIQVLLILLPLLLLAQLGFYAPGPSQHTRVSVSSVLITLVTVAFLGRYIDKRKFSDYGIHLRRRAWWVDYGIGTLAGLLSASVYVGVLVLLGWVTVTPTIRARAPDASFAVGILIAVLTYTGIGIFEETLRAYQVRNISEGLAGKLGPSGAIIVAALASGVYSLVMHTLGNDDWAYLGYIFITGSIYGLYYAWTGRAAIPMALHAAWDFALSTIFALGGAGLQTVALFTVPVHAPDNSLLSLSGVLGKLIGLLIVAAWVQWREGGIRLHKDVVSPSLLD
jgi:membrane protease YdiL (CAAX protease family)